MLEHAGEESLNSTQEYSSVWQEQRKTEKSLRSDSGSIVWTNLHVTICWPISFSVGVVLGEKSA